MDDGGMGGLRLSLPEAAPLSRVFGDCVSEVRLNDVDDVVVIVSLYVDRQGHSFEVDIWKVDFTLVQLLSEDRT